MMRLLERLSHKVSFKHGPKQEGSGLLDLRCLYLFLRLRGDKKSKLPFIGFLIYMYIFNSRLREPIKEHCSLPLNKE